MIDTETKLRALVAEHLNREADSITTDAVFGTDLGADSLDSVELSMLVEDAFQIELTDDEALDAFDVEKTFGDALKLVQNKLDAQVTA